MLDKNNLVGPDNEPFFTRYFVVILFINGGLYFLILGFLQYIGFISPYYSEEKTDYDKAKFTVTSTFLAFPIIVAGIAATVVESNVMSWKFIGFFLGLYWLVEFLSGIAVLVKKG
ncbi:MAG: hypothetical protein D3908_03260 [Candidatus Electrothrix sp. AUS4]|nr:hypothetical protein [Candidatus Electrothrix sp. AUS4]